MINRLSLSALVLLVVTSLSCSQIKTGWNNINLFTPEQDIELGKQVSEEILANPKEYPVLDRSQNLAIYQYVEKIRDEILSTGKIQYKQQFAWDLKIIDNDSTLNAFVTPGGYIYVYTGILSFLESQDELAGVLGHEIAHADQRHSTKQLTKVLGVAILADAVLGERDALEQVVTALFQLSFSRTNETEADSYSVEYLCQTPYYAAGAAGFFKKMEGQPTPPEFLSTHPNPSNRVKNLEAQRTEMGCTGNEHYRIQYKAFKELLKKKVSPFKPEDPVK
jgi:predicted Zn-dependent protease